jgi:uncharacterized protein (TIGR00369 family)
MIQTSLFDIPMPPCAALLGWRLLEANPKEARVTIAFEARPEFRNPAGFIQGGFLAAMLDDTMGPAALMASDGEAYTVSVDMNVSFLKAAKPGTLVGEGRVIQRGKTIAFLEAALYDAEGDVVARATSTARLVSIAKAMAA